MMDNIVFTDHRFSDLMESAMPADAVPVVRAPDLAW